MAFEYAFVYTLWKCCFKSNRGHKPTISKIFEHVLGKLMGYGHFLTLWETQVHIHEQTKSLADVIVQLVLFNTEFIALIADTTEEKADGPLDEWPLQDIEA